MDKKELRKLVRELKKQHSEEELKTLSQSIARSVHKRIEREENCHTVLLYHSLPDEVCTHQLIPLLAAEGVTVLLPTIAGDELELHQYTGLQDMGLSSSFGIQESTGPLFTDYTLIDLAIIPGMAFTTEGHRLGRGKGFYDRLLPQLSCPLIGVAFPFQILSDIPVEPHDVCMAEVMY